MRRPEGNGTLDLNNLPEDYTIRDGKLDSEDTSSSAVGEAEAYCGGGSSRKKKSGGDGKDDGGGNKVYECRFCSLKFCKSQALGGHMNRHRQERETETLNKARQLVLSNDLPPSHLGYVSSGQAIPQGGYHHHHATSNMGSMYPTRLFPTSSPFIPPPPLPHHAATGQYMYPSPPRMLPFAGSPPHQQQNDYFVGHVLSPTEANYTCIGAPVGHGFGNSRGLEGAGRADHEGRLSWDRRHN